MRLFFQLSSITTVLKLGPIVFKLWFYLHGTSIFLRNSFMSILKKTLKHKLSSVSHMKITWDIPISHLRRREKHAKISPYILIIYWINLPWQKIYSKSRHFLGAIFNSFSYSRHKFPKISAVRSLSRWFNTFWQQFNSYIWKACCLKLFLGVWQEINLEFIWEDKTQSHLRSHITSYTVLPP